MNDPESNVIVQSEELDFKAMLVKCSVLRSGSNKYSVLCKAYDRNRSLLWTTELLDEHGVLQTFDTKEDALNKAKKIFSVYR